MGNHMDDWPNKDCGPVNEMGLMWRDQ